MKKLIFTLFCLCYWINGNAQQDKSRTYLELNGGLAILNDNLGGAFPGISFLVGQQHYFTGKYFFEYQAGVSLPSFLTAKLGVGATGKVVGGSIGLRVFPTFVYGQVHFRFRNGQLNFSAEASPFYNLNFEFGPSFGANAIFTCGYQWAIGKGRIKKDRNEK